MSVHEMKPKVIKSGDKPVQAAWQILDWWAEGNDSTILDTRRKAVATLRGVLVSDGPLSQQGERSELRLLSELIERNPERAREFLARLSKSMEVAA